LFNHFGASFYPGVNVFTEHPVVELGHGIGPFYKSPDETKFLTWLRNCLIREEGTTLQLAPGAPRAWLAPGQNFGVEELATFFGAISYRINSTETAVTVTIDPPQRLTGQSISLHLRRPDDQRLQSVTVNGQAHTDFDPDAETIQLTAASDKLVVEAGYV
jgi:hypothetical protein